MKRTVYQRIGERIARFAVERRALTLAIGLLVFFVFALGGRKLAFSTDYRIFFSKEDQGLAAFERLEQTFSKTDNILFVVKPKSGDVFDAKTLAEIRAIGEESASIPFARRVDSIVTFQVAEADGDDVRVRDLVPAGPLDDEARARARTIAKNEPILVGSLLARDLRTTGINVTIDLPRTDPTEVSRAIEAAREIAARSQARHPNLDVRVSGMAAVNHAFMETSVRDMRVMIPLMLVVMLATMAFLLRSASAMAAVGSVIAIAGGASMTIAGWLGYPLTPPSVAAPMMVLTVAIADGVHIVLGTMHHLHAGRTRSEAIVASVSENLEAVTYTWLTTVVGFLCLNYSEALPVNHLANMTSVGVTLAFVYSVTFMPALLACLPLKARAMSGEGARDRRLRALADWIIARRNRVLAFTAIVTVVFGVAASRLETNDQFIQYFSQSTQFRKDADFTMANLSGIYRLEFQVPSEGADGVVDPAYLAKLDAFTAWFRTQPEVDHAFSFADVMKGVHAAAHADEAQPYRLPATRASGAELLLLYEMALPPGLDLKDRISADRSSTRLSVIVKDMSSREMTAFATRAETWLTAHTGIHAPASGPVVIFSALSDRNARGMVQGDFLSLVLVSICMMIVLRNVRLGLLSVVPNVVPIIVGYGVWYYAVGQMNVVATVAGSISLGIIVDDTIHFLTRFQTVHRETGDVERAMKDTLAHAGPAMLSTSIILVAGFGVLTFSAFQMTSYLGWLSILIVGVAPACDLCMVPALVLAFHQSARSPIMKKSPSIAFTILPFAALVLAAAPAHALTDAEVAAQPSKEKQASFVLEALTKKNAGYRDMVSEVEMSMVGADESETKRRFRLQVLERPSADVGERSLLSFDAPADVKGTQLLSHAGGDKEDEQWLYLPSTKRVKRIALGNRGASFLGSEFAYEDLTGSDTRKFAWTSAGTAPCAGGGGTCIRLEGVSKDASSTYGKRAVVVELGELRIRHVEFFDKRGALMKTLDYDNYTVIGGKYARPTTWTMKNVQTKRKTILRFANMKIGTGLTANDLSPSKLEH